MNSEKPWVFPKIALYFAIAYPAIIIFLGQLIILLVINIYGTEILDTDLIDRTASKIVYIPLAFSVSMVILCGFLKKSEKDKSNAFKALIISIVALCFSFVMFDISVARYKARQSGCLSSIKQISLAFLIYENDYDSHLPPLGSNWNSILKEYKIGDGMLHCPNVENSKDPTYALNKNLAGLNVNNVKNPENTILIFESKPGKNLFGTSELLPKYPRHFDGDEYGFLDGHAKSMKRKELITSKFQPIIKTEKSK